MPTIVIYNPLCGDRTAKTFFDEHVLPLFAKASTPISSIMNTERVGHAGELAQNELEKSGETLTIVLGAGDGTLHEIINHLSNAELKGARIGGPPTQIHLVLVPCGTANALYASLFPPKGGDSSSVEYKLQSVMSYLKGADPRLVPLTLAITTLSPPPAVASSVVVSTSIHASILHDSEALRATIPGTERFKVAAKQNGTKWYNSHVKLLPVASLRVVQLYDPDTKSFINHPDADDNDPWPVIDIDEYHAFGGYVRCNDRSAVFRSYHFDGYSRAREAFANKVWAILQGAYQDGAHVNLSYDDKGQITTEQTDNPYAVEYIRCGGWEWIPDDLDDDAHLVCCDGAISTIEKGGRAVCVAATPDKNAGFLVHV
ncbi:hypothetical protein D9757_001628 [Collybiopsis confluens]|uniref:DAGKc domain-containing protein n=1 Tax=Collybiopsis confluens TaxID=2823264 RepID=A0A8H5HYG9_9AGAR|nr:hypothetical protein D9757_001628 [Collybiopsis confluens]